MKLHQMFMRYFLGLVLLLSHTAAYAEKRIVATDTNTIAKVGQEFLPNGNGEGLKNPWTCYNDGAVARPIDGTGGTTSLASTIVRQSFAGFFGLNTDYAWKYTHPASNVQGQGCSMDFTVNRWSDGAGLLQLEIDHTLGSIGFTNGTSSTDSDVIFYLYDKTNNVLIEPDKFRIEDATSTAVKKLTATFQTSYNATDYRLIFHNATTTTTPFVFDFRASILKPSPAASGPIRGPVGSIAYTGSLTPPTGYLYADGSAVSRSTYAKLFAAIGTTYGAGDGTTTFNIPNLKGVFVRGAGSQTIGGITSTATLGTSQGDQMQGHYHNAVVPASGAGGTPALSQGSFTSVTTQNNQVTSATTDGTNGTPRVGTENRPANVAMAAHICFDDGNSLVSSSTPTAPVVFVGSGLATTQAVTSATNIQFNTVKDSVGGWNGSVYTVKVPGDYNVGSFVYSTSSNFIVSVYKNGGFYKYGTYSVANNGGGFNVLIENLVVGDTISLRTGSVTLAGDVAQNISISKVPNGATAVNQEVSVAAAYKGNTGQTITNNLTTTVLFSTLWDDTHGSYNPATGIYTVKVAGRYAASAKILYSALAFAANTEHNLSIAVNGTAWASSYHFPESAGNTYIDLSVTDLDMVLKVGDQVTITTYQNTGASKTIIAGTVHNTFSIHRTGN